MSRDSISSDSASLSAQLLGIKTEEDLEALRKKILLRNGRLSGMGGKGNAKVAPENGKASPAGTGGATRFMSMKKIAEDQREKVRKMREQKQEEERQALAAKRQEEMKLHMRQVMDQVLVDVKKDLLTMLQDKIDAEKEDIKGSLKEHIEQTETSINASLQEKMNEGEPLDDRIAKMQKEFEDSFQEVLKKELDQVQKQILENTVNRIDKERKRWEDNFKREADRKIRTAKDAIQQDFRIGLEDSQKQCNDIIMKIQEKTTSLEEKLNRKIAATEAETSANIEKSEKIVYHTISEKMDERDQAVKQAFYKETKDIEQSINEIRAEIGRVDSKCCVIL